MNSVSWVNHHSRGRPGRAVGHRKMPRSRIVPLPIGRPTAIHRPRSRCWWRRGRPSAGRPASALPGTASRRRSIASSSYCGIDGLFEATEGLAGRQSNAGVQGLAADGHDVLDLPQVAAAGRPVIGDAQFAQFEAREAARAAEQNVRSSGRSVSRSEPPASVTQTTSLRTGIARPMPSSMRCQSSSAPSESSLYMYSSAAAMPRVGLNAVSRLSNVARQSYARVIALGLRQDRRTGFDARIALRVQVADAQLGVVAQVDAQVDLPAHVAESVAGQALAVEEHVLPGPRPEHRGVRRRSAARRRAAGRSWWTGC